MFTMQRVRRSGVAGALALVLAFGGIATGSESGDVYVESSGSTPMQKKGFNGSGVTVAVIDTGVANVPAMGGAVVHQQNFSAAPADGDQYGHGTFVAGAVHRTAPGAKIVSLKLSGADGAVDVTQVLAALQWVVNHRDEYSIDVVNLSFGNNSKQSWRVSPLNYGVQRAWDAGIVVVASAGNLGDQPGTVTKPGDDPLVITVGSTNDRGSVSIDDDTIPGFVSRGPTQDGLAKPDLVAPGKSIISVRAPGSTIDSQYPGARVGEEWFRGSGTSFSAPIVSGIVAQLLQADPTMTPDEVKYALMKSAGALKSAGAETDSAEGSGTVRALKAYQAEPGVANAGVGRSDGSGLLDDARGDFRVVQKEVLDTGLIATDPIVGDETAADALFDQAEYLDSASWNASQWGASQWGASQWGASQWGASQWGASQWGASQWWASQWG